MTAINSHGSVPATSTAVLITAIPAATSPIVGQALAISGGTWTENGLPFTPTSELYQWLWADTGAPILSATSSGYDVGPLDVGHQIGATVIAVDSGQIPAAKSAPAALLPTGFVTGPPAVASHRSSPAPSLQSQVLTVNTGTWQSGYLSPATFAYQWNRVVAGVSTPIGGQAANSLHPHRQPMSATRSPAPSPPATSPAPRRLRLPRPPPSPPPRRQQR